MGSPEISLEAAFGANRANSISTWSWTELGDRVAKIVNRGPTRNQLMGRIEPGLLTVVLDNSDGYLNPRNGAAPSPYASGGSSNVIPRLPVRFSARFPAGSGSWVRRGFGFRRSARGEQAPPAYAETTWSCPDGFAQFATTALDPVAAVGSGETTGARVDRILSEYGWALADRTIDAGVTVCAPTTLGGNVLALLQKTAEAEFGDLFMAGNGNVTFRGRTRRLTATTPRYTFSDTGAGGTYDHTEVEEVDDDSVLINTARFSRPGGAEQLRVDSASVAKVGPYEKQITDLVVENDVWADSLAHGVVLTYGPWAPRLTSITVDPTVNDALWPVIFDLNIGDYIRVIDGALTSDCWVEGMTDTVTGLRSDGTVRWRTTIYLSPRGPIGTYSTWGTAVWGTTPWAW